MNRYRLALLRIAANYKIMLDRWMPEWKQQQTLSRLRAIEELLTTDSAKVENYVAKGHPIPDTGKWTREQCQDYYHQMEARYLARQTNWDWDICLKWDALNEAAVQANRRNPFGDCEVVEFEYDPLLTGTELEALYWDCYHANHPYSGIDEFYI